MSGAVERAVAAFLGEAEIDWEKLKPVMCFIVLWNRLEARCGNHLSLARLLSESKRVAGSANFNTLKYTPHIEFFKQRYTANPDFLQGLFRVGNGEAAVRQSVVNLLSNAALTPQDQLQGVLMVPYRIRNNLFHGNKETSHLYSQIDLFEHVNEVLCLFQEDI
ncbi:MAG: hypothetical protein R3C01_02020 [Planctomycetaceae bacterium]